MNEKEVENETLPITEDKLIALIMNANSLTAGLDAIESMAINFESDNKKDKKSKKEKSNKKKENIAKNKKESKKSKKESK